MEPSELLSHLNPSDLIVEATALMAWEIGAASDMESVVKYMCRGGPWLPQASARPPRHIKLSEDDPRPEKKYWLMVKRGTDDPPLYKRQEVQGTVVENKSAGEKRHECHRSCHLRLSW